MDDDGQKQRLLDVIGDPHALETFLETLPSSSFPTDGGLLWQGLDSPRFDNVTPSTDPGLINSCLDNLVFDGQFLGQVRGGSHPLSHPHVLQQVLPSSSLPTAQQGASHPQQQQPQSQQQHQQHQHQPQQQHQHPHTHHQQNVALPSPGAPQVGGAPSSSGGEGSRENEHPALQQLFGSSTTFSSQQHTQPQVQSQTSSLHQQNAGTVGHSISPAILTTTASRLPSIQQASHLQQQLSVHPTSRPVAVRSQVSPAAKNATSGPPSVPQPTPQVLPQAAAAQAPTQVMPSSVQLVGGPSQVITSGGQIITSAAPQLLQGTQLLQGPGSTQVMPTGQLLPGQVLHNGPLIQGGQVLHGAHMLPGGQLLPSGQVIQGGQVLSGGQLIQSGSVISSSQLITTTSQMVTSGLNTAPTSSYVTPSALTVQQQQQQQSQTPVTLHQSGQSPASAASPFSVPTKSPGTALPRTSPSPSYHPTTPSPHPSVQSPAPYTTRSPAPSPHTSVGTMKSPAPPTPSPAATPTPQTHTNIAAAIPQQQAAGMVQGVMGNGGMVQSLVPQLPLSQVMGSNGMVLPQTTVHQQAAAGVKQVVSGGQIIQIVSSPQPTQQRQSLTTPAPKPIQPKQPQLLPKPPQPVSTGQPPPPPPPGKSIISTRSVTPGGQQPIVIGAAGQPTATMMASQQGIGGFVINPSPLQSGLQQPILIQQPNGVLLVRPSGPSGAAGAPAQAILVPMPSQTQIVSAGAKGSQPQTVVFPTSGQGGPAFVFPQNAASSLGASGVMGAAQGARGHQPIIRLVAPQAPLQLQQIPTPNGPTLVALPTGQVNLSGLLTAGGATMRTLAPQVAPGPLQLAPSSVAPPNMAPVAASMGHLQMAGAGQQLQVSVPGAPLQLATSLPSSLPSVITTTKQTVIDESVAAPPPPPAPPVVSCGEAGPHNQTVNDTNKTAKKKPKKKKKEKDPKDEKLKSKGGSINLNDILKETGIMGDMMLFDDNELGLGGDGMEVGHMSVSTSVKTATPVVTLVTTAQAAGSVTETVTTATVGVPDSTNHVVLGTHQPMLVGMNNPVPQGTVVISSAQTGLPAATTMPSGMCLTLDPSGKVILGADPSKTHIAASSVPTPSPVGGLVIPSNQPQVQVISSGAVGVASTTTAAGITTSGTVVNVMNNSMPTIMSGSNGPIGPGILPTVGSLPSFTQLLTPPTQVTTNVTVQGPSISTRSVPVQLQSPPTAKVTQVMAKTQTGADISRVAQNTHLLQAFHLPSSEKTTITSGPPILTSITSGQQAVASTVREPTTVPMQVSVGEGGSMVAVVSVGSVVSRPSENVVSTGTTFSSPAPLSILVASQASQVPPSPAVIASSSATNSVVSGAIISHKPFVTNSALTPQTNVTYTNSESVPISRGHPQIASALHHDNVPSHINSNSGVFAIKNSECGSKPPSYQNEYVATLQRSQNLIEASKNKSKSNKKRKKDKEVETVPAASSSPVIIKQSLHDRLKASGTSSASGIIQPNLSSLPNGLSNLNLKNASHNSGLPHYPSVTIPASACDGVSNSDTAPVVGSSMPTVSMSTVLPSLTTTATASVQTPPINTTISSTSTTTTTSHSHTGVLIPGQKQQVKQVKLILSPQNQEALKKVHNKIQAIQHNKPDQDPACLPQLLSEYRKIMATGKHYTVTTSPQQSQIPQPPSQPTPVRYSHPVGHKIITLTQFKQQIKHLQQDQPRQVIDQSKPVLQRWKETPTTSSTTTAGTTVTQVTTTPHVSRTSQNSTTVTVSRPSVSPVSSASMPIITTSAPSPTVPTTSTTVTACITSSTFTYTTRMAPPQCSPVSSTSSNTFTNSSGPSPKSSASPGNILPSQTSPRYVSSTVNQEHPSPQAEPQQFHITKDQLFEHQLRTDQNGAVNPEYRTPFKNKIDACKRLIRYHVFSDKGPTQKDLIESDNQIEIQAESLLKKFSNMKYKYQSLLLKDSMRRHASSEYVMLYRLFVQEDKTSIERDKAEVQNGKVLDLPPAPAHWLTGEARPSDPPYPWESEWENQKEYICDSMSEEEEEEEDQTQQIASTAVNDTNELVVENKLKIEDENDDFDGSQEGDPQLEIFMDEEEEEEEEEEAEEEGEGSDLKVKVKSEGEINTKSSGRVLDMQNNISSSVKMEGKTLKVENDFKQDGEGEEKLVICDNDMTDVSPLSKPSTNESEHLYDSWTSNNRENDNTRFTGSSNSPVPNPAPSEGIDTRSPTYDRLSNDSCRDTHSPSLKISERPERDKRKEKSDKDKDRRKADKIKDKERARDREKEDRPPKKLKIKFRHDERAIVPPLRIRTEERGSCLKLTLKKQEGSEAYYSVGEERKREYRVETHEDDEEEDCVENVPEKQLDREGEDECEADGGHDLKEVKVVLQDVLKDKKFKLKKHEEERTTKRKKRERSDDRNDRSDRRNRNNYHWSNHAQDMYQTEGERNSSQQSNYDGRTWNHNSNAEWTRSGGSVDWRRTSNSDSGDWQRTSGEGGHVGEWHRGTSEGASSVSHSSDNRSSRDYSPHLLNYNEHYDTREFSSRQNHSQSYGHSGSQSRNTHNYH